MLIVKASGSSGFRVYGFRAQGLGLRGLRINLKGFGVYEGLRLVLRLPASAIAFGPAPHHRAWYRPATP